MEIWKRVRGFFGACYDVSDQGRVRRRPPRLAPGAPTTALDVSWLPLAGGITTAGYRCVALSHGPGTQRTHDVHVLVCEAFHGPRPTTPLPQGRWEVRHLDGDKLNNRASNLAWGTAKTNGEDRVRHGTSTTGETNPNAKLDTDNVVAMRRAWGAGRKLQEIADEHGICLSQAHNIVRGDQWGHVVVAPNDDWLPLRLPGFEAYLIHREGRLRRETTAGYWRTVEGEAAGGVTLLHVDGSRHHFQIDWLICHALVGDPGLAPRNRKWRPVLAAESHWESVAIERTHSNDKLDATKAAEIKRLLAEGVRGKDIAERYGISKVLVSDIKHGRAWRDA